MISILDGIQGLMNLLFFAVVAGTVVVSWVYGKWQKIHNRADFTWKKAALIVGLEVLLWIGFNFFWNLFEVYWWQILIVAVIVLLLILRTQRKAV